MHVTTTFTSSNNLGLVITGLTEADVGTYTCTAMYSNSEYLVRSVTVDSFCKYYATRGRSVNGSLFVEALLPKTIDETSLYYPPQRS